MEEEERAKQRRSQRQSQLIVALQKVEAGAYHYQSQQTGRWSVSLSCSERWRGGPSWALAHLQPPGLGTLSRPICLCRLSYHEAAGTCFRICTMRASMGQARTETKQPPAIRRRLRCWLQIGPEVKPLALKRLDDALAATTATGGPPGGQAGLVALGAEEPTVLQLPQNARALHRRAEPVDEAVAALPITQCYLCHEIRLSCVYKTAGSLAQSVVCGKWGRTRRLLKELLL